MVLDFDALHTIAPRSNGLPTGLPCLRNIFCKNLSRWQALPPKVFRRFTEMQARDTFDKQLASAAGNEHLLQAKMKKAP